MCLVPPNSDILIGSTTYEDPYDQDQPVVAVMPVEDDTLTDRAYVYVFWRDNRQGVSHIYMQQVIVVDDSGGGLGTDYYLGIDHNRDGDVLDTGESGADLQVDADTDNDSQETPSAVVDREHNVYCTWRDSGDLKNNSLRTERGIPNSRKKLRGGTMIAWHRMRMVSGTNTDSSTRWRRRSRGTRLCRYWWANEMCRASSAT